MRIMLPNPETREVVEALIALDPKLGPKLNGFVYASASSAEIQRRTALVHRVTTSTARALLAAKIVMPSGDAGLRAEIEKSLSDARHAPALRDLALSIVEAEMATEDDAFRDPKEIPSTVFDQRIAHIREFLTH
jgi:hypothetical protein